MSHKLEIAFFGSSLVSAYWNGAATYYRGMVRALNGRGHRITFYEPDALDRQSHRDIDPPDWARVVVYDVQGTDDVDRALEQAGRSDVIVKASGVGVLDEYLEGAVLELRKPGSAIVYWDVDAPATLDRVERNEADPFRERIGRYDLVLTYGGGQPVIEAYESLGARRCVPVYNALDPATHHPVVPEARFRAHLSFLGNRLPDREARFDEFFLLAAGRLPDRRFLLGGNGWENKQLPANVDYIGHVYTRDHNALNCSSLAVLNINRDSMARYGFSPPTRIFEAAGAGACLITDRWDGIELFLEPGREILIADSGDAVANLVAVLSVTYARRLGQNAFSRIRAEHTYAHRAAQVETLLTGSAAAPFLETYA